MYQTCIMDSGLEGKRAGDCRHIQGDGLSSVLVLVQDHWIGSRQKSHIQKPYTETLLAVIEYSCSIRTG